MSSDLLKYAEPLGELDGYTYRRVTIVLRCDERGVFDDLGPEAEWYASVEARLINAYRVLAELRAELAQHTTPPPVPPAPRPV